MTHDRFRIISLKTLITIFQSNDMPTFLNKDKVKPYHCSSLQLWNLVYQIPVETDDVKDSKMEPLNVIVMKDILDLLVIVSKYVLNMI